MSRHNMTHTDADHRQEAGRLREMWRRANVQLSQREFGEMYDIGNQSAVSNFLQGRIPISLKAAIGFAAGLGCQIEDFSPRLAKLVSAANSPPTVIDSIPAQWEDVVKREPKVSRALPHGIDHAKTQQIKSELYAAFLSRPEIRLLIRILPPADPHDVMLSLLKSAFDQGFDQGASTVALDAMATNAFGRRMLSR